MVQVVLAGLLLLSPQQSDTATFSDAATAELYARARVRHIAQDTLVRDYRATVRTRMDASAGRSRFARQTALFAHESVAEVGWQAPNDLQVKVLGTRAQLPIIRILQGFGGEAEAEAEDELRRELVWDRPWFIPRALGDSIRLMGVPDRAALHPMADGATDLYRYAITDSVQLVTQSRTIRALKMRVEPKSYGPALVAGDMWLDTETADIVQFGMVFLGDYLWESPEGDTPEDSARALKESDQANRFLSVEAQVEYALVDQLYWMPYRQFLAITVEIPMFLNAAIPVRAVTTFTDYTVNSNPPIVFHVSEEELAESEESGRSDRRRVVLKAGTGGAEVTVEGDEDEQRRAHGYYRAGIWRDGHWEMDVPPGDSLLAFEWDDELDTSYDADEEKRLRETFAELSELSEELPPEWLGRRRFGIAWESVADIVRFNRVQGLSLGIGYEVRTNINFTSILLAGRFGISDKRVTGSVTWRRDGPGGRLDLKGFRAVTEVEPWTRGQGIGNSLNALFVGNDDADYYLTSGGGIAYAWNHGFLQDVELNLTYERHQTMDVTTTSAIAGIWGTGVFQPNPPVEEGWFFRGSLARKDRLGVVTVGPGADVLAGQQGSAGRLWAVVEVPFALPRLSGVLTVRGGVMRGDSLPQMAFRLGGPQTVRGFTYGERRGREFWSAQLDVGLGRSRLLAPVVFFDIGDTFSSDPFIGAGAGVSLLNGLIRFNLSKGIQPDRSLRFDLLFRAPR